MQTALMTENETKKHEHETRVHIDRHPYESPNPTTGAALYALGKVPAGFQLYREAKGDTEDEQHKALCASWGLKTKQIK